MKHCCNCKLWKAGNSWMMSDNGVVAAGYCRRKKKLKQNNNIACKHIETEEPNGFILQGQGDKITELIII